MAASGATIFFIFVFKLLHLSTWCSKLEIAATHQHGNTFQDPVNSSHRTSYRDANDSWVEKVRSWQQLQRSPSPKSQTRDQFHRPEPHENGANPRQSFLHNASSTHTSADDDVAAASTKKLVAGSLATHREFHRWKKRRKHKKASDMVSPARSDIAGVIVIKHLNSSHGKKDKLLSNNVGDDYNISNNSHNYTDYKLQRSRTLDKRKHPSNAEYMNSNLRKLRRMKRGASTKQAAATTTTTTTTTTAATTTTTTTVSGVTEGKGNASPSGTTQKAETKMHGTAIGTTPGINSTRTNGSTGDGLRKKAKLNNVVTASGSSSSNSTNNKAKTDHAPRSRGKVQEKATNAPSNIITPTTALSTSRGPMPNDSHAVGNHGNLTAVDDDPQTPPVIMKNIEHDANMATLCVSLLLVLLFALVVYTKMWRHKEAWEGFRNMHEVDVSQQDLKHILPKTNIKELIESKVRSLHMHLRSIPHRFAKRKGKGGGEGGVKYTRLKRKGSGDGSPSSGKGSSSDEEVFDRYLYA